MEKIENAGGCWFGDYLQFGAESTVEEIADGLAALVEEVRNAAAKEGAGQVVEQKTVWKIYPNPFDTNGISDPLAFMGPLYTETTLTVGYKVKLGREETKNV